MIRLIVNADDLGSGPRRDRGIFAAFQHGIVSSASLLANGPGFVAAAHEVRACGLPVGVHLNLSQGRPLAGAIPGLTDAAGNFPGKVALRSILRVGSCDRVAIRRELLAQIEHVCAAGLAPDHLDSHQHCLLFPALTGLIAEVAELSGIRALRLPQPVEPAGSDPAGAAGREMTLYRRLAPAARQILHAAGLWTPQGLWGMPLLNRLDTATLAATLAAIPAGTWELMTHPGRPDPHDPFGGPQRATELTALTDPEIGRLISVRGIELTSFGVCACAC
jgi:predicted glycoside hydrolase/deacetylase ChbG (UPF0249 family)